MSTVLNDAFTDTSGTALSSHVPTSVGTSWTQCSALTGVLEISNANRLRVGASNAARGAYYSGVAPSTADQTATCDHVQRSTTGRRVAPAVRLATTGEAGYSFGYNTAAGQWELYALGAAGAPTTIGTYLQALTLDQVYALILRAIGTTVSLTIDTVERISVTDSTTSATNRVGAYTANTNAGSDTIGSHIDNLVISDSASAGTPIPVFMHHYRQQGAA